MLYHYFLKIMRNTEKNKSCMIQTIKLPKHKYTETTSMNWDTLSIWSPCKITIREDKDFIYLDIEWETQKK